MGPTSKGREGIYGKEREEKKGRKWKEGR